MLHTIEKDAFSTESLARVGGTTGLGALGGAGLGAITTFFQNDDEDKKSIKDYLRNMLIGAAGGALVGNTAGRLFGNNVGKVLNKNYTRSSEKSLSNILSGNKDIVGIPEKEQSLQRRNVWSRQQRNMNQFNKRVSKSNLTKDQIMTALDSIAKEKGFTIGDISLSPNRKGELLIFPVNNGKISSKNAYVVSSKDLTRRINAANKATMKKTAQEYVPGRYDPGRMPVYDDSNNNLVYPGMMAAGFGITGADELLNKDSLLLGRRGSARSLITRLINSARGKEMPETVTKNQLAPIPLQTPRTGNALNRAKQWLRDSWKTRQWEIENPGWTIYNGTKLEQAIRGGSLPISPEAMREIVDRVENSRARTRVSLDDIKTYGKYIDNIDDSTFNSKLTKLFNNRQNDLNAIKNTSGAPLKLRDSNKIINKILGPNIAGNSSTLTRRAHAIKPMSKGIGKLPFRKAPGVAGAALTLASLVLPHFMRRSEPTVNYPSVQE